ncbi:MAG: DMT family transporter, partial [Gammaproteobacteria bacterium]|nr:DMT family transporter [Gammaproteobacteria bacterium]
MRLLDAALAVVGCTLWGLGFTVGKATIESCPPIFLMAMRYGLAGIVLVWLAPRPPRQLARVMAFSFVGVAIADSLLFVGMREVSVSTSVLILQLAAPLATLIAVTVLRESLGGRKAAGTVLAFVGVALVVGQPGGDEPIVAMLLIAAGALAWAAGQVIAKTITDTDSQTLVAWAAIFAVPPLLLSSLLLERGHI